MAASEGGEPLDDDLLALIQENEALQAENEALRRETADHGVFFDEASEATEEQEAAWLQVKIEALKRERESLQDFLELSHELNDLQLLNATLREVTNQLMGENQALQRERHDLQRGSVLASTAPSTQSSLGPKITVPHVVPSPVAMTKTSDLQQVVKRREGEAAPVVRKEQQKEIVSNMLKTGFFAPAPGTILASIDGEGSDLNANHVLQLHARSVPDQEFGDIEVDATKPAKDPMSESTMSRFARETKLRKKLERMASIPT